MIIRKHLSDTLNKQQINNPFHKIYTKQTKPSLPSTSDSIEIKRKCKTPLGITKIEECNFFKIPFVDLSEAEMLKESSSNIETIQSLLPSFHEKHNFDSTPSKNCLQNNLLNAIKNLSSQTIAQLSLLSTIPLVSFNIIESLRVCFPEPYPYKKTAVIDLDETLISTHSNYVNNSEPICSCGEVNYVKIRPGATELLESISKHYEIVIFTASQKDYADKVIRLIDRKCIISHALYRDSVVISNNQVVKDLRILYRNLKDVVIIDNCAICMAAQPENGILVRSYNGEERDNELNEVMNFLNRNENSKDLREEITHTYKLKLLSEYAQDYRKGLPMDA